MTTDDYAFWLLVPPMAALMWLTVGTFVYAIIDHHRFG